MNEKGSKEIAAYDDHHDFHPDPAVIARLRRKIDWHLLPLLSLMYLFSFLDRVNIGIANMPSWRSFRIIMDTTRHVVTCSLDTAP
jgi:hypothetical protein